MVMVIEIPQNVNSAIEALQNAGFEAFAVGGAVRDSIMGRPVSDWDIAASATVAETERVFADKKIIETGIKHGTVTVLFDGEPLEITTFRIDGEYSDNRHPDSVEFTRRVEADLSRRDFTVNAMAYNHRDGLVDLFGGRADIEKKLIRCVGEPDRRFSEDALRILRALRFASVLGFSIDEATAQSVLNNRSLLKNVARERIAKELLGLICGKAAAEIIGGYAPVFLEILPELRPALCENREAALSLLSRCKGIAEHRLAALLSFCGEADALKIMRSLRLSNRFSARTRTLVSYSGVDFGALNEAAFKKTLGTLGREGALDVLTFNGNIFPASARLFDKAQSIFDSGECLSLAALAVNGSDITAGFLARGSAVGDLLDRLLDCVLSGEVENTKSALLKKAEELI